MSNFKAAQTKINLQESIDQIDVCNTCFGQTDIYLDPQNGKLWTRPSDKSVPRSAYHNIDQLVATVSDSIIPSELVSILATNIDELVSCVEAFQGTEWDGNNHVGQWSADWLERQEYQAQFPRINDDLNTARHYWSPEEWFDGVMDELQENWEDGMTASQIIDDQYLGDNINGCVDRDKSIEWLESRMEEWASESD